MDGQPFIFVLMGLTLVRKAFSFLWEESCCVLHQWRETVSAPQPYGCLPGAQALVCGLCACSWSTAKLVVLHVHPGKISQSSLDNEFRQILLMPVWEWEAVRKKVLFSFCFAKVANHTSQSNSVVLQRACAKGLFSRIQDCLLFALPQWSRGNESNLERSWREVVSSDRVW